jgi:hypothetical protein
VYFPNHTLCEVLVFSLPLSNWFWTATGNIDMHARDVHVSMCVSLSHTTCLSVVQSPSVGMLEMESNKGTEMFLREMHTFLREMQHMTPTMRFDLTQKALLDM